MSTSAKVPPDRVMIRDGDATLELSILQFAGLPLTQRVRYLLAGQAEFFAGASRLDTAEALRCILEARTQGVSKGGG